MERTYEARLGDRSLFPDLEWPVYCNHAAISPPSLAVRDAVGEVVDSYARVGVSAFPRWKSQREDLRARLARMIGARPEDLGFVNNTTAGVVTVALCYPWRAGDRVVLFEGEFPTNVTPWLQAARAWDLEPVFLRADDFMEDPDRALQRLEDTLRKGVRMVAVSAVAFQTGLRMPTGEMARLCHEHGAEIFVDGIQALGAVPLDVRAEGVDYLASGGHKWLMGMEGGGFVYVRADRVDALHPMVAGWMSHEEGAGFLFRGRGHLRYDRPVRKRADFVEGGMPNTTALASLGAATDLLEQLGPEAIFRHVQGWIDPLEEGLRARGFRSMRAADEARRSCNLAVLPGRGVDVVSLQTALQERGVSCSIPDGYLRFSPHWPNHPDEVPRILEAVDDAL
ncbi:MAG: aminotransferase class V-fold PLP-dependent enzyme [Myxococcota bacterium]